MTDASTRIRRFATSDLEPVISLWSRCGLLREWNDPVRDIQRKLADSPDLFLVVESERGIIGTAMVGYDGHRGAVNYLAVEPELQSMGIGRRLMLEVERLLVERGCPKINILIRDTNVAVREFYLALGYKLEEVSCMGKRLIPDN